MDIDKTIQETVKNLLQLLPKKGVTAIYGEMYEKACQIAVFEMKKFKKNPEFESRIARGEVSKDEYEQYFTGLDEYQKERIDEHMKSMKELFISQQVKE